ncbi:MAG TPA: glutathione S-transferase N-terminal domain-containing protein [Labilithrix sp.]|nr:glutathione S-transferase N-terminal domain-containing protein [Labilithrix sp.]
MIDVHFWPTPNGQKITIYLEEAGLPYRIVPVNIGRGEQFKPEFLALSPNNRMPAVVDDEPSDGGAPISVFESAAILQYLAEKTGQFMSREIRAKKTVLEWLAWQVANVGPACGQLGHFKVYAKENLPYAIERFSNEVHRLFGVLDRRLSNRPYVADDYSIADMAIFPWFRLYERFGIDGGEFPHVKAWVERIAARPAVGRALEVGRDLRNESQPLDEEAKKHLFGQRAPSRTS